jgi:hypothetical protein
MTTAFLQDPTNLPKVIAMAKQVTLEYERLTKRTARPGHVAVSELPGSKQLVGVALYEYIPDDPNELLFMGMELVQPFKSMPEEAIGALLRQCAEHNLKLLPNAKVDFFLEEHDSFFAAPGVAP